MSVSRLCKGLVKRGVSVRVVTTNAGLPDLPKEDLGKIVYEDGVEVIRFPAIEDRARIFSPSLVRALPDVLSEGELIHLSAIWQPLGPPIQRYAHKKGVPVLNTLRGALSPYSFGTGTWKKVPYFRLRELPLLQKSAGIHVTSSQELREIQRFKLSPEKYLVPNPLDISGLYPDVELRKHWRQRLGFRDSTRVLLVCGRMHHKKGLDQLVEVLASQDRKLDWNLLLVGKDEDGSRESLISGLSSAGINSQVSVVETMASSDLIGVYNASDLLLLPSRHENFGNVVIEALACGCAVLVSDQTGVAEDLIKESPGYFGGVLKRDPELWNEWIRSWLHQPRRTDKVTIDWVAKNYGQEEVVNRVIKIYRSILRA